MSEIAHFRHLSGTHVRFAHLRCGSPSSAQCTFRPRHEFFSLFAGMLPSNFHGDILQAETYSCFFSPFLRGILIETMCLLSREGGGASWRVSRQTLTPAHALAEPSHRDQRDGHIILGKHCCCWRCDVYGPVAQRLTNDFWPIGQHKPEEQLLIQKAENRIQIV